MKPRQVRGIGSRKGNEIKWKLGKIIDETWGSQDKILVRLARSVKVTSGFKGTEGRGFKCHDHDQAKMY